MNRTTERPGNPTGAHTAAELIGWASAELRTISGDDALLEAQVLLARAFGVDRSRLLAGLNERVARETAGAFEGLVERRKRREPLAYIVGSREFYGIEIACSPAALIPRPETEMLVHLALDEIERRGGVVRVCDVGTGSGAIAVAVAVHAPRARITATDASADALTLAHENARRHGIDGRIEFVRTDLLHGAGRFDVIVTNLPYVSDSEWSELEPELRDYEPRGALVGGESGTEIIERFLREASQHVEDGGVIAVEIGATQGVAMTAFARGAFPRARVELMRDLAGLDRLVAVYTREEQDDD
jgi:release factor glutamine methyltransferase